MGNYELEKHELDKIMNCALILVLMEECAKNNYQCTDHFYPLDDLLESIEKKTRESRARCRDLINSHFQSWQLAAE